MRERLELQRLASNLRESLGADLHAPIDVLSLATANPNITVVFYPFENQVSGLCIKKANLIAINSRTTKGRQNFSLAHELYHYYFNQSDLNIVDPVTGLSTSPVEKEADLFATHLLVPDQTLNKLVNTMTDHKTKPLTLRNIIELEQYFKVSRQALLSRLIIDYYLTNEEAEPFRTDIIANANLLGFDDSLYKIEPITMTLGAYIPKVHSLKEQGMISQGKYEEYLQDAFRQDLVFGEPEDEVSEENNFL